MIVVDCEQGTRAWHEARLGIPTASEFKRIVTNGGAAAGGEGRLRYRGELLVEWATGEPYGGEFSDKWTEYGKAMEPAARAAYRFHRDLSVSQVGLCYRDDARLVAASPDGLVGGDADRGALELKCPSPEIHLLYLSMGVVPTKYATQVQGHLWVTGLEWCDFMSFHPDYPALIVRVFPDPARQAALDKHLPAFVEEVLEGRRWLEEAGVTGWEGAA